MSIRDLYKIDLSSTPIDPDADVVALTHDRNGHPLNIDGRAWSMIEQISRKFLGEPATDAVGRALAERCAVKVTALLHTYRRAFDGRIPTNIVAGDVRADTGQMPDDIPDHAALYFDRAVVTHEIDATNRVVMISMRREGSVWYFDGGVLPAPEWDR